MLALNGVIRYSGHTALSWHADGARPRGRTRGRQGLGARPGGMDLLRVEPVPRTRWDGRQPLDGLLEMRAVGQLLAQRTWAGTCGARRRQEAGSSRGPAGQGVQPLCVSSRQRLPVDDHTPPRAAGRSDLGPRASLQARGGRWWPLCTWPEGRVRARTSREALWAGAASERSWGGKASALHPLASACWQHLLMVGPPGALETTGHSIGAAGGPSSEQQREHHARGCMGLTKQAVVSLQAAGRAPSHLWQASRGRWL